MPSMFSCCSALDCERDFAAEGAFMGRDNREQVPSLREETTLATGNRCHLKVGFSYNQSR